MTYSTIFKGLVVFALCMGFYTTGIAQKQLQLTLQEVCEKTIQNSAQLKASQSGIETARQAIRVVKSALSPTIQLSASASYIGNGYLTQRNWSDGQTVEMPHFGNNFAFEASQVVFAGGSIINGIEKAKLQEQLAALQYKQSELDMCFLVTGYYLDLYKLLNQREVFVKNIEQTELLIEEIKNREVQGMALFSDVTRHELRLQSLKLALIEVDNRRSIINQQLLITMGLPDSVQIIPHASVIEIPLTENNAESLLLQAQQHLPSLQAAAKNREIASKEVRLAKSDYYPQIGIFANNHYDGPIMIEVPVINQNFDYWMVGVGLTYNLSSTYKTPRKVALAKQAEKTAQYQEEVAFSETKKAVYAAYTLYQEAFKKYEVYETNLRLAQENYEIINNRYLHDLVLITEMLDAQTTLLNAQLELVNAKIDIVYKYHALMYQIGAN